MHYKSVIALVFGLCAPILQGAEAKRVAADSEALSLPLDFTTFNGKTITAESLPQFKELQAPAPVAKIAHNWLLKNRTLVESMPVILTTDAVKTWVEMAKKYEKEHQLHNLSSHGIGHNLITDLGSIDGKKYYLQMSGPENREENHNAFLKKPYGNGLRSPDDYKGFTVDDLVTYQTVSRAATCLRLREAATRSKLDKLHIAPTYLVPMPWVEPGVPASDSTYIVVQEEIPDMKSITKENAHEISPPALTQLAQAIVATPLWHVKKQLTITKQGLALVNYEQPNNTPPNEFFNKKVWRFYNNAHQGLEDVAELLASAGATSHTSLHDQIEALREQLRKMKLDALTN